MAVAISADGVDDRWGPVSGSATTTPLGRHNPSVTVVGLWRYPVKGLLGEELTVASFAAGGVEGDRAWAIVGADGKLASGKTTRRFRRMPNLFTMSARTEPDGEVVVFGEGWEASVGSPEADARVSEVVGEPATLEPAEAIPVQVHDEGAVHLLTVGELDEVGVPDARRFRPNVLLDRSVQIGDVVSVGAVRLRVVRPMPRCVMTSLAQPAHGLGFDPTLARIQHLGVVADVLSAGEATVGAIH